MKRSLVLALAACGLLAACASPHVVQKEKLNDNQLTCSQIKAEIDEAIEFEKKARGERKVTGKNVAAALFFWPALAVTYVNSGEAIDAARERQAHLTDLYKRKGCR